MALLRPGLGAGFYFGSGLRGNLSFFDAGEIKTRPQVDLRFISTTGDFIGQIGTGYDNAPAFEIDIQEKKIGGLTKLTFTIPRDIEFPFFNLMSVQVLVNQVHWYTAELQFLPGQDRRDVKFKYSCKGYVDYLKKTKTNKTYSSKKISEILTDLIKVGLAGTPVNFNQDKIITPEVSLTTLEANDEAVFKTCQRLLGYANSDINQVEYRFGVDKEKDFYFMPMSGIIVNNFFEGYNFQNPDVSLKADKLVNKINIYRTQTNSDNVEYVTTIEDLESQGLYGLAESELLLSNFYDIDTAKNIATAKLEYYKAPKKTIEIADIKIKKTPYEFELYCLNSARREYTITVSEFDDLAKWKVKAPNTTITESTEKVLTGRKSFKFVTGLGSEGEYLEIELDSTVYFATELSFYASVNKRAEAVNILLIDESDNVIELEQILFSLNSNELLGLNNGELLQLNSTAAGLDILILEDFQKQTINLVGVDNIKKIRILFITNDQVTMYFDRLELKSNQYFSSKIFPERFDYKIERGSVLTNAVFGDEKESILSEIDELSEKEKNITNIFEKGSV